MRGFVYALINPSLVGLVKVGRTDRDPEARAQELSGHTGTPTPFMVAYQRLVNDSEHAESWVHTVLERRGYRLSERREFFKAPLHEVVEAIHSYPDEPQPPPAEPASLSPSSPVEAETGDEFLDSLAVKDPPPWLEVLMEAQAYDYGSGEQLEDPREAFRLYRQAAQLGSSAAYRRLGEMCNEGRGTSRTVEQALAHYKKAAAMGDYVAYACMADLFKGEGHEENQGKCWRRFVDTLAARVEKGEAPDPDAPFKIVGYLRDRIAAHGEIYGAPLFRKLSESLSASAHAVREYIAQHGEGDRTARISTVDSVVEWLRRG